MVCVTSPRTPCALPMTGVILVLLVNNRVGGSLENLILKISSRVIDRRCLWGKLLSSMIRYRLNVTIIIKLQSTSPKSTLHYKSNYRLSQIFLTVPICSVYFHFSMVCFSHKSKL